MSNRREIYRIALASYVTNIRDTMCRCRCVCVCVVWILASNVCVFSAMFVCVQWMAIYQGWAGRFTGGLLHRRAQQSRVRFIFGRRHLAPSTIDYCARAAESLWLAVYVVLGLVLRLYSISMIDAHCTLCSTDIYTGNKTCQLDYKCCIWLFLVSMSSERVGIDQINI